MKKLIHHFLFLSLTLFIAIQAIAQAPNLRENYSARIFKQNAAITPFNSVTNSGGSIPSVNGYSKVTTPTYMPPTQTAVEGKDDGPIATAKFSQPQGLAKDAAGNIYVTEKTGNRIRKINFSTGQVTTVAGDISAILGVNGQTNANGTAARFWAPTDVVVDSQGNLFVTDMNNHGIRKITLAGDVTLFAGPVVRATGMTDATGTAARFNQPWGITIDSNDNLYVVDRVNNRVRKITPNGVVTTFAGTGTAGSTDGAATAATFNAPTGIEIDSNGDFYIADGGGNRLRKITTSTMTVSTIAGSDTGGTTDGQGTSATFSLPSGVAVDEYGVVYVSDKGYGSIPGNKIRRVSPDGFVMALAGSVAGITNDVVGTAAKFRNPSDLLYDKTNRCLYVADCVNHTIRRINLTGYNVTPSLPTGLAMNMLSGDISGTPTAITSAVDYKITGFNTTGASSATMNIAVADPSSAIYTITSTAGANGQIKGSKEILSGGSATFTITPNTGYEIDVLKVNEAIITNDLNYTFSNVTSNQTIDVTFKVLKINQTIIFDDLTKNVGESDFNPATSATSAINPITYVSSNLDVAAIVDGLIHIIDVGTTEITASQAGNNNHNAAPDVKKTLTINARPVITLTGATNAADLTNSIADVTVSGNCILTVNDNKTIHNVTLEQGANIEIVNDKLLEVNDLTLKAGYSGNLYDGFSTSGLKVDGSQGIKVNGRLRYVRTIDDTQWYFVAFPYDVTVNEITSTDGNLGVLGTNWFVKYYDGTQRATGVTTGNWKTDIGTLLHANQGYIIALATGTKELIFPMINNTTISAETNKEISVTYFGKDNLTVTENHKGWNLIGQPFLSKFNTGGTNLPYLVFSDGGSSKTYSVKLPNEVTNLNPFVSFFVQANDALETNKATFSEAGRHLVPSVVQTELSDKVRIYFSTSTGTDDMNLLMDDTQTTEYKIGQDLEKWIGTGTPKPQIYTITGDVNYAYNALPISSVLNLPIGFYSQTAGTCTLKANAIQTSNLAKLLLTDTKDKITTDLLVSDYSFTCAEGTDNSRFVITAQRVMTDVNITPSENGEPNLLIKNSKLVINNLSGNTTIRVYDIIGHLCINKVLINNSAEVPLAETGMYTVQIKSGDKNWVKKISYQK